MGKEVLLIVFLLFLLAGSVAFASYIDVSAMAYSNYSSNVTVKGYIKFDNSSGIQNTNVSGVLGSSNFTVITNSLGYFEFNLSAPNSTGQFNVSLSTNNSLTKDTNIYVSNISAVLFNFTDKKPPFTNGTPFIVNVSFTGNTPVVPLLDIFNPNSGNSTGWVIANLSAKVNVSSVIYNITVPANADGIYIIIFEKGAGSTSFLVKSSIIVVAGVQDSTNSSTTNFGQGENITVVGKIRDDTGPIITANVTAYITLPNSTVVNVTLTHSTVTNGTYTGVFVNPGIAGEYDIEIVANTSTKIIKSSSTATVQQFDGKLEIVKDFFFDFGSSSSFRAGGPVEFNILITNLTTDTMLNGSLTGNSVDVNCTSISVQQYKNSMTGAAVSSPSLTKSIGLFNGQNVCKIRFTAPSADGIYAITLNASIGATNATVNAPTVLATGYFSVQSYIMKPSPVSSIGGGKEFLSFLMPGDNATFEISVRNLSASNGAAVAGNYISNFNVTKISPMSFTGTGDSSITNITILEYTAGTATANPRIKIVLPENRTGPNSIEFQATVNGTTITGTAFYFARYVEGFVFPGSFGGGFGAGPGGGEGGASSGGGGGGGGPPGGEGDFGGPTGGTFKCSGLQNFTARIFDVRTRQAARSVTFNSIQEAREEMTGRSVANSLSLVSSTSTDSNGVGNLTINFTGSMSGFHFMLINITTSDGKSDSLPGGFECRQLSFFPQIQAIGTTTGGYSVAPSSGINVTIGGIKNLITSNTTRWGTVTVSRIESYDPSKGPKFIPGLASSFNLNNGTVAFTLFPTNFSGLGGKWFNGFNQMVIRVCDNSTAQQTCDTSFSGFQVVAFDAFQDYSVGNPSQTLIAGTNTTYNIMARTNVTNFTVQIGMPWEGSLVDANVVSYSLKSDGWDNPSNNSYNNFERWNITFTVPSDLRKGGNMITIKVTNYLNETTDIMTFGTASKLSISVPDTEGAFMAGFFIAANVTNPTDIQAFLSTYSLNLTTLNSTYNVNSKSGRVCVARTFNTTRYGMNQQNVIYSGLANTTILMLDNSSAGNYDTFIVSVSSGSQIGVVHSGNRSLSSAGFGYLYFAKAEDCGYVQIVNSQLNGTGFGSGFGGQHAVNTIAQIPFIARQGSTAKTGVTIDVFQIIKQEDFGGGRGGFGFSGSLPSSSYTVTSATTDANGIAFLRLNVSTAGSYSIMWNFSTAAADNDVADFSEGVPIEIKALKTDGGILTGNHPLPLRVATFTRSDETRNATIGNSPIYAATWNESSQGEFLNDGSTRFLYLAIRNSTQSSYGAPLSAIPGGAFTELVIDNDGNLNTTASDGGDAFGPVFGNFTEQFGPSQPSWRNIMGDSLEIEENQTVDDNTTKLVFANPNMMQYKFIFNTGSSNRMDANITVRTCAYTFTNPQKPIIGATVSGLITRSFSFSGPPATENLTIYSPFNGSAVASLLTGYSGCAVFNVSRVNGWKSGAPNEIKATITSGSSSEQVMLGNVMVSCPSSGSCF
ncbi:hypothetical protein HYZ41_00355 [archaeon]|nr:hypothetical protein [archaeon]